MSNFRDQSGNLVDKSLGVKEEIEKSQIKYFIVTNYVN